MWMVHRVVWAHRNHRNHRSTTWSQQEHKGRWTGNKHVITALKRSCSFYQRARVIFTFLYCT